jgi:hypothetical protein
MSDMAILQQFASALDLRGARRVMSSRLLHFVKRNQQHDAQSTERDENVQNVIADLGF